MNDHLMVEDPMPWDHLALDTGRKATNGSQPSNGWRPESNGKNRMTQEDLHRVTQGGSRRRK
ncbi:MAG: hypothetical protein GEU79_15035 [Acidimicrobiia bacterium]|nr:hypothetical protein [Acidimicrobiia bacterium]